MRNAINLTNTTKPIRLITNEIIVKFVVEL